jgi:hypothetical protein
MGEKTQSGSEDLKAVKALAKAELAGIDGVEGIGIGDRCLRIYIRNQAVAQKLPQEFHGVCVEVVVTGTVTALKG